MHILFIHQNFPGQFRHLVTKLSEIGHKIDCLTSNTNPSNNPRFVTIHAYSPGRNSSNTIHPWLIDFESKTIRAEAVFRAAEQMNSAGYEPDVVVAHPGWGESLFIKDVWPRVRLGLYCEYYYQRYGADIGFDPEFPVNDSAEVCRLRLKNLNNDLHFDFMDAGITPTAWQASTYPSQFRDRISVIHDGIDTELVTPNPEVKILLAGKIILTRQDEIITFVNRNLEPCRGFHTFMRSLPKILKERPNAVVLVVGGDEVSYGKPAGNGLTWRQTYLNEIASQIDPNDMKRLHFLGNLSYGDYLSVIQISTVHVYLTYPFVLSWSMLEAMSAGCAVVASKTPPVEEVISHGKNGLLVDFFDSKSLSETVCDLLNKPLIRNKLGESARKSILSKYDLKTICLPSRIKWIERLYKAN